MEGSIATDTGLQVPASATADAELEPVLRLLLVSYNFPPVGGAGVQRPAKLVKYIHPLGFEPTVLTVRNPSVPLRDESVGRDVPHNVRIVRAPTFEPGYAVKRTAWRAAANKGVKSRLADAAKKLLVPDAQILWQPGASVALARELMSRHPPDVVCISAPPFSQFLLALLASRRERTAVVFDYRDEWSAYRENYEMMSSLSARVGDFLEPRLLRLADLVITATEAYAEELLQRFPFLRADRVRAIPNGYDVSDFPTRLPEPPTDKFVVTYAGTVLKLNSPRGLLEAVRRVHATEPELARLLRVRFIGRIVETEQDAFRDAAEIGVECIPYLPHQQLVPELAASHLVLCIMDDVPGTERMYPGKIFELMHLRRPCLILAPECALTGLVRRHQFGETIAPRDVDAIAASLIRHLSAFKAGTYRTVADATGIERYDRRATAAEFADAFRFAAQLRLASQRSRAARA